MFVFTENLVGFTIVWFCIDQAWHQTLLLPSSSEKSGLKKHGFMYTGPNSATLRGEQGSR